jgi:hypothetical protein
MPRLHHPHVHRVAPGGGLTVDGLRTLGSLLVGRRLAVGQQRGMAAAARQMRNAKAAQEDEDLWPAC